MRAALTAVAVALTVLACGFPSRSPSSEAERFKMRIAGYYWPGMYWVDVAKEKGFFAEAGIDAEIVDASGDYLGSLDWVAAGKVDTNVFNLYDVLRRNAEGSLLQLVLLSDTTLGADVLLAKSPIRAIASLKGKRIGLIPGSYQEAVLASALESGRVGLDEVTIVPWSGDPIPAPDAPIDALVTWEPFATDATDSRQWNRLFDTSRIRGGLPFGYAFRSDYVARHPMAVQRFVEVWHRTSAYMEAHPLEAHAIVARRYGQSPDAVAALAKFDIVYTLDDNVRAFAYGAGPVSIHNTARRMSRLLIAQDRAARMIDSTLIVEPRFVRALAAVRE
ncbi:MAG TPA: ABC transporter substrate-binding protein [Thermoanaerobaculia bacterium]